MPIPTVGLIDHLGLQVPFALLDSEVSFLNACLAPLGIKEQFRLMPQVVAMGDTPQNTFFWVSGITRGGPVEGPVTSVHLAFRAKDRKAVDDFHAAAMAAGGKECDNGAPGIREQYHKGYYAAFVATPAGNNLEAVVHESPTAEGERAGEQ